VGEPVGSGVVVGRIFVGVFYGSGVLLGRWLRLASTVYAARVPVCASMDKLVGDELVGKLQAFKAIRRRMLRSLKILFG